MVIHSCRERKARSGVFTVAERGGLVKCGGKKRGNREEFGSETANVNRLTRISLNIFL